MSATSESSDEASEPSSPDSARSIPRAAPARPRAEEGRDELGDAIKDFEAHKVKGEVAAAKHYCETLKKVANIEHLRLERYRLTRDPKFAIISEFAKHAAEEYNLSAPYYKNTQSRLKKLVEHLVDDNYHETGLNTISKVGFFDKFMKSIKEALASKIGATKPTQKNIVKLISKLNEEAKAAKVPDNAPEKTAHEETKAQAAPDDEEEEEEEVSEEEEEKKEDEGATLCGNQPVSEVT